MIELTDKQIRERFKILPDDVRLYALSPDFAVEVEKIGKDHKLHIDQLETLMKIVNSILLGFTSSGEFIKEIQKNLHLTDSQGQELAADVNEQIFKPVQDSLRAMQEEAERGHIEERHLSREELLHQIENPVPTPMSGRREGGAEDGRLKMEDRINTSEQRFMVNDSGLIVDTNIKEKMEDGRLNIEEEEENEEEDTEEEKDTEEEGTPVPISTPSRPRSIFEKKLADVTVAEKSETPADPYREAVS